MKVKNSGRVILRTLYQKKTPVSGNVLCRIMQITPKTLRKYIKELNESICSYGEIIARSGVGYSLVFRDEKGKEAILSSLDSLNDDEVPFNTDRVTVISILQMILIRNEATEVSEIAEFLSYSEHTIIRLIPLLRENCATAKLRLVFRKNRLAIMGSEYLKRWLYSRNAIAFIESDDIINGKLRDYFLKYYRLDEETYGTIHHLVTKVFDRNDIRVSLNDINMVIHQLSLASARRKFPIDYSVFHFDEDLKKKFYLPCRSIILLLPTMTPLRFNDGDEYLLMIMLGNLQIRQKHRLEEITNFEPKRLCDFLYEKYRPAFRYDEDDPILKNFLLSFDYLLTRYRFINDYQLPENYEELEYNIAHSIYSTLVCTDSIYFLNSTYNFHLEYIAAGYLVFAFMLYMKEKGPQYLDRVMTLAVSAMGARQDMVLRGTLDSLKKSGYRMDTHIHGVAYLNNIQKIRNRYDMILTNYSGHEPIFPEGIPLVTVSYQNFYRNSQFYIGGMSVKEYMLRLFLKEENYHRFRDIADKRDLFEKIWKCCKDLEISETETRKMLDFADSLSPVHEDRFIVFQPMFDAERPFSLNMIVLNKPFYYEHKPIVMAVFINIGKTDKICITEILFNVLTKFIDRYNTLNVVLYECDYKALLDLMVSCM